MSALATSTSLSTKKPLPPTPGSSGLPVVPWQPRAPARAPTAPVRGRGRRNKHHSAVPVAPARTTAVTSARLPVSDVSLPDVARDGDADSVTTHDTAGAISVTDDEPVLYVTFPVPQDSWVDDLAYRLVRVPRPKSRTPHPKLSIQRAYLEQRAFDQFVEMGIDIVVDVGGNPRRHHTMSALNSELPGARVRAWCHSCCPDILPEDAVRGVLNQKMRLAGACGDFCTLRTQQCLRARNAQALLFVHSHYYFDADEFARVVFATRDQVAMVVCHFFNGASGNFEHDEATWKRDMVNDIITMHAKGNAAAYRHPPSDFVRPGVTTVTSSGLRISASLLESVRDSALVIVKVTPDTGVPTTSSPSDVGLKAIGSGSARFLIPEGLYASVLTHAAGRPTDARNLSSLCMWMRRSADVSQWAESTHNAKDALHVLAMTVLTEAPNDAGAVLRDMIYDTGATTADMNSALAFQPQDPFVRVWRLLVSIGAPRTVVLALVEELAKTVFPPIGIAMLLYEAISHGYSVARARGTATGVLVGLGHAIITAPVHVSAFIPLPGLRPLAQLALRTAVHAGFNVAQRVLGAKDKVGLASVFDAAPGLREKLAGLSPRVRAAELFADAVQMAESIGKRMPAGVPGGMGWEVATVFPTALFEEALKQKDPRWGWFISLLESLCSCGWLQLQGVSVPDAIALTGLKALATLPLHATGYVRLFASATTDLLIKTVFHATWNVFVDLWSRRQTIVPSDLAFGGAPQADLLKHLSRVLPKELWLAAAVLFSGLGLAALAEAVLPTVFGRFSHVADVTSVPTERRRRYRYVATTCFRDVVPLPPSVDEHFFVVVDGVKYTGRDVRVTERVKPYSLELAGETIVLCKHSVGECRPTPGYAQCGPLVHGYYPVVPRPCVHNELIAMTVRGATPRVESGESEQGNELGVREATKWFDKLNLWPETVANDMLESEFLDSRKPSQRRGIAHDLATAEQEQFAISMHVKVEALIKPNAPTAHFESIGTMDALMPPPVCKPRHIQARQPRHQLVTGPPLLRFMSALKANCSMGSPIWVASGYTAEEYGDWFISATSYGHPFHSPPSGYSVGNGDATNYDSTHNHRCFAIEHVSMERLIADSTAAEFQVTACVDQRGRSKNGLVYGHKRVRPSGDAGTTALNCACNSFHLNAAMDSLGVSWYRAAVLGDDIVIIVLTSEVHLIREGLARFYMERGFLYEFDWFSDVRAAEFCSGHFWPCIVDGVPTFKYGPKPGRMLCKMMACVSPDSQPDLQSWIRDRLASAEAEACHVPVVRGLILNGLKRFGRGKVVYDVLRTEHWTAAPAQVVPAAYDMAATLYDTTVANLLELEAHLLSMPWESDMFKGATALSVQDLVVFDLGLTPRSHMA